MKVKAVSGIMLTLLLVSMLTLAFNIEPVSAGEYSAIYIDPPSIIDSTLTPGKNFTISIRTDYAGSDIWLDQFTLSYNPYVLHGVNVTNGDLITKDKDPSAMFFPGEFDNAAGTLSLTGAFFLYIFPPSPVTSGPGILANVTFTVVGTGASNIILGNRTRLIGWNFTAEDFYPIIDAETMPDHIQRGYFNNVQPIHDVAVIRLIAPATTFTGQLVSIKVIVANEGSYTESVTVKVSYDSTEIGTEFLTLASGLFKTLSLNWDTTDLEPGTYTITAEAILDEDADPTDNRATTTVVVSGTLISVPYHYQTKGYYCGPGSLEMVFDFYGPDISQREIADAANTVHAGTGFGGMIRAAHFSNLSTSVGDEMPENVTGYSARKLGYAAFHQVGFSLEELRSLIDSGYPIIVATWYSEEKASGHYRVVVGYNETHVILHDPWSSIGPMLNMTNSKFLDLWGYSYYSGLFVSPWNVDISAPQSVREEDAFTVRATVNYPCPTPFPTYFYPASLSNATIKLPKGMSLVSGENAKKLIGDISAGNSATVSWTVQANSSGTYTIEIEAEGKITGHFDVYSYEDRIGGLSDVNVTANTPLTTTVSIYPSTLNLRSRGRWIIAHIELPEDYNVGDIDVPAILLNDVVTAETSKVSGKKLTARFDKSEVAALLSQAGEAELTVTGTLFDGTPFEGSDSIRVVFPSTGSRCLKRFGWSRGHRR